MNYNYSRDGRTQTLVEEEYLGRPQIKRKHRENKELKSLVPIAIGATGINRFSSIPSLINIDPHPEGLFT